MKNQHYYFYLTENEMLFFIQALVNLRNNLIEQNKSTNAVDDVLCIVTSARKKRVTIKYV
jgi:hypothetical protein